jgi:GrpB-like predicted nucleotidyltransferase (UPF0157 family)
VDEDAHREELRNHLDRVLVGGIEKRAIEVVEWRSAWSEDFEFQRARIARALGGGADRIEHIGSTAVPNLPAKPVIDILVSVADPDNEELYAPPLKEAGYVLRVREPGHRMFRTPRRDVHPISGLAARKMSAGICCFETGCVRAKRTDRFTKARSVS